MVLSKKQKNVIDRMQAGKPCRDLDVEMGVLQNTVKSLMNKGLIRQDGKNYVLTLLGKELNTEASNT